MSLLLNKNQVQDFMANSDKYNFRFYRKDKERIVAKDYDLVKDLILSEDRYSSKLPVSHNSPFIFEVLPDSSAIEMQIEPYKNYEFWLRMDELLAEDRYIVWTRKMLEAEAMDYISIYGNDNRTCFYHFDRIEIEYKDIDALPSLSYETVSENLAILNLNGYYTSCMSVGEGSANISEPTISFESKLALQHKLDIQKGLLGEFLDYGSGYSISELNEFMSDLEGVSKVVFKHKGRVVRECNIDTENIKCYTFDDWDNCADDKFNEFISTFE